MRVKTMLAYFAFLSYCLTMIGLAGDITTQSPDGRLALTVHRGIAGISYSIDIGDTAIIEDSPISITIDDNEYPGGAAPKGVRRLKINGRIKPTVATIVADIHEKCNETLILFDGPISLRIRAYNDGVAYRWESVIGKERVRVNAEKVRLNFAEDFNFYMPVPNGKGFFSHQENKFKYQRISESGADKDGCAPVLFELPDNRYMLLTDVNVEEYPGLWIRGSKSKSMSAVFPGYPAKTRLKGDRNLTVSKYSNHLARTQGERSYPWRAFVIAKPKRMLTSTFLYCLATPCRLSSTEWIKPGKVSWDWWNHWNITDVPFEAGVNQATYMNYIDFASNNGLQYIILDEGWSVRGPENLLKVRPELDIGKLVEYADSKDVGVILWMTGVALQYNFDKAFDKFDEWGIKGLKVDFMQRDDQVMMDFCSRVAELAAAHKLLVDFHGGSKPTGLQRTYPNVLTQESVLGLEQSKWGRKASPDMAVLLPFIRMMTGPMDYTPGAMDNYAQDKFKSIHKNPGSQGTRCHQLAMYVAFLSPLQMLADTPTKYRKNPKTMEFLRAVPTTWEETRVLEADVGDLIALARRDGRAWYLCALTDWKSRQLDLSLDFLGDGEYSLKRWEDGPNATTDATDTAVGRSTVTRESKLKIELAPGGGYVAILEQK